MVYGGEKPTEWIPSQKDTNGVEFPYVLLDDGEISCKFLNDLSDEEIAFDGRKEEKMKISKDVYDALVEWRDANHLDHTHINGGDLLRMPTFILNFWLELGISQNEANNRLIAILRWVNGEDVFEVEKPKKWVVRSKYSSEASEHLYVNLFIGRGIKDTTTLWGINNATRFDTKEEAESWANSHQEVIEVEE